MVATGRLGRVPANPDRAHALLAQATRHLASAAELQNSDPPLAYVALYDAARKAILAHMLANGLRETARPGAHQAVVEYGQAVLVDHDSSEALLRLDRLRRNRNRSEYESWEPTAEMLASDLKHAAAIVDLVAALLSP